MQKSFPRARGVGGVGRAALRVAAVSTVVWGGTGRLESPARAAEDVVYKEETVKPQALPPATAPAVPFDRRWLTPFFTDGPIAQAAQRLGALSFGASPEAAAILKQLSEAEAGSSSDVHVRYLLALAELRTAQAAGSAEQAVIAGRAAEHFLELRTSYPMLASYHTLHAARALEVAGRLDEALARAKEVPADSVLDCEARYLRAEIYRQKGEREPIPASAAKAPGKFPKGLPTAGARSAAAAEYRALRAACPSSHRHEVEWRLAELLDGLGLGGEAQKLWRRLYIEAAHEKYAAIAEKKLEQPPPGVSPAPAFTAPELLERAQVLFDQMRNPESEAAYRWVLTLPELDIAQACTARYNLAQSVFKQRQRQRAAPLFDDAVTACGPTGAKNDDLHMKAMYQAARCHASGGNLQKAADLFALAEAAHPGHSYADDSRLRQAEMYQDLEQKLAKDGAKATCQADACPDYPARLTTLLSELPDRFPDGDRRAEALFRLALRSLRKKDYAAARTVLGAALEKIPRETGWDQEGRTLYFLGRTAELLGDKAAALASYRRTTTEYPLSYYTLIALSRLRAGFPKEYAEQLATLYTVGNEPGGADKKAAAASDGDGETFLPKPRALFAHPAFLRGIELLRLAQGSDARREFQSIGITVPAQRGAANLSPEQEELLWLAALLYDRAGAYHLSHFIPRHVLTEWQRHYPAGPWRKHWLLAYPRGFLPLVKKAAAEGGQPEALELAIIREESAFDPRTESFANAVGLTQMIQPTAKRFSGGLPYDRESLRDPAINLAIGGRFLAFLWQLYQGNAGLAVPSYNAGEHAVVRWLNKSGAELGELDLFVESIPFDETRGYTKRVLSTYLTYSWLYAAPQPASDKSGALDYGAAVPTINFTLPKAPSLAGKP